VADIQPAILWEFVTRAQAQKPGAKRKGGSLDQEPARARQLGVEVGGFDTGACNAITDVTGVAVGHTTLDNGADIRTGVTAIVPAQIMPAEAQCAAAIAVGNGHGKLVGSTQVAELGVVETPILLTATLSTFRVADALVQYMLALPGYEAIQSINPVVGETNDGFLSDIRALPLSYEHVAAAIESAVSGPVAEGAVGAGTGTGALGFKAGVGTSSRVLTDRSAAVTIGTLVQANFSGTLTVMGVPIPSDAVLASLFQHDVGTDDDRAGNSCVIVVATDAPLDARQLQRVARRALVGLARVGSDFAGGSGDYALAISTARPGELTISEADIESIFRATIDSVEEAILNSLFMARTTTGYQGHTKYAVPHSWVRRACAVARQQRPGRR
jgi:D-aminopeptidase